MWCRRSWTYGVKSSERFCKYWVSFGWKLSGREYLIIWSQSGRFGQDFHICLTTPPRHIILCIFVYIIQSLFLVNSVNTGVLSWKIKPPECEFNNFYVHLAQLLITLEPYLHSPNTPSYREHSKTYLYILLCPYIHTFIPPTGIWQKCTLHCSADCISYYPTNNNLGFHHILRPVHVLIGPHNCRSTLNCIVWGQTFPFAVTFARPTQSHHSQFVRSCQVTKIKNY